MKLSRWTRRILRVAIAALLSVATIWLPSVQVPAVAPIVPENPVTICQRQGCDDPESIRWRNVGRTIYPIAATISFNRNPRGVPLDETEKLYLRPIFGDLVDRVEITYNAQLIDRWGTGSQQVRIGEVNSVAQTYCDRIYIAGRKLSKESDRLVLLAHELVHSRQCQQLGGLVAFGERYFHAYYQANRKYADNSFEKEARQVEKDFVRHLCQRHVTCPPTQGLYYPNYKKFGYSLPVKVP
jgi:hypothetical protein